MKPHGTYDTAFQAGAASRDAEIVALNSQVERLQAILARRLIGLCICKEESDRLREQVEMLRTDLKTATDYLDQTATCNSDKAISSQFRKTLAATEPKE